mgnify:CR=1 FL=1
MVITKHFAIHGKNYRSKLIKYILNPSKTKNLSLVSDFGMRNYLDFPSYEELVKMYNDNFLSNDSLYEFRHDRQEIKQRKIHSHHIIQSFSPDDHFSPEQINRILNAISNEEKKTQEKINAKKIKGKASRTGRKDW